MRPVGLANVLCHDRGPRGGAIRRHLPSMVHHLARHADMRAAAGPFLDGLESGSALPGDCLAALGALAEGGRLAGRGSAFEAALCGRLRACAAARGVGSEGPGRPRAAGRGDQLHRLLRMLDVAPGEKEVRA